MMCVVFDMPSCCRERGTAVSGAKVANNGAATSATAPPFLLPADGHAVMVAPFGVAAIMLAAPTISTITVAM